MVAELMLACLGGGGPHWFICSSSVIISLRIDDTGCGVSCILVTETPQDVELSSRSLPGWVVSHVALMSDVYFHDAFAEQRRASANAHAAGCCSDAKSAGRTKCSIGMDTGIDGWWLFWHAEFRSDGHYDMKRLATQPAPASV